MLNHYRHNSMNQRCIYTTGCQNKTVTQLHLLQGSSNPDQTNLNQTIKSCGSLELYLELIYICRTHTKKKKKRLTKQDRAGRCTAPPARWVWCCCRTDRSAPAREWPDGHRRTLSTCYLHTWSTNQIYYKMSLSHSRFSSENSLN